MSDRGDDGACAKEQQGFENGMAEQMELTGKDRAGANRIDHETQLADGRISQHAFDIVGGHRHDARQQRREQADHGHRGTPARNAFKSRVEAGQQIDACVDHRGGMDEGGHRCGCFHGIRQPGMQGHLR